MELCATGVAVAVLPAGGMSRCECELPTRVPAISAAVLRGVRAVVSVFTERRNTVGHFNLVACITSGAVDDPCCRRMASRAARCYADALGLLAHLSDG